jgi:hypothetical protein
MVKQGIIREIAVECVVNGQYAIITVYHYGTEAEFIMFKEELELVKLDKTNIKNQN